MIVNQTKENPLFIGIDGGGSKCRATIYSAEDGVIGTGVAGRANPLHGLSQTFESIQLSTELALKDAGMAIGDSKGLVAGLGLAGVNVPRLYQDIVNWEHPFADMYVTSDLHTACIGAHKGGEGAVIITGTGSCGYANVDGKFISLGGHGFALGDKGSGAWLGLKAAEQSLLHLDGFAEKTILTEKLLNHFKVNDALGIVENLAGKSSSVYAKLARIVLECANQQDEVAQAIVKEGAAYISELARKLFEINPPRFSMIGGLAEPLAPWLDKDVVTKLSPTLAPPELGATYFARQQFGCKAS
ncbi:N-acetylglucosamine kinase [Shewanella woodyi]|uniref:ATPase BadF/BadG/BcrA/BcrD type n=1 Tax=Shewanella woodyi (strain ATCC 51908 / MS32) TaxID=392500 RepID=B1KIV6_SHEWM|nr:BadF/BadG/BcrA/BcrD ATPase family protein [Shewanella woodyi]ACA85604.1 ATPase BadF/BadG/BcrA/BcrD type [Shewanella woodyi ATCC 51908]